MDMKKLKAAIEHYENVLLRAQVGVAIHDISVELWNCYKEYINELYASDLQDKNKLIENEMKSFLDFEEEFIIQRGRYIAPLYKMMHINRYVQLAQKSYKISGDVDVIKRKRRFLTHALKSVPFNKVDASYIKDYINYATQIVNNQENTHEE